MQILCTELRREAGLRRSCPIERERERMKKLKELARHRDLLVVGPDDCIQGNLGEEEGNSRRRRTSRKLSWWLERGQKVTNSD